MTHPKRENDTQVPTVDLTKERRRAHVENTFASWSLDGFEPDERDRQDADAYIEGHKTAEQLLDELRLEYGARAHRPDVTTTIERVSSCQR